MRARLALPLLLWPISGCGCQSGEEYQAVWSDDGEAIGLLVRAYHEESAILWTNRIYDEHRLEITDASGGGRTAVSEWIEGDAGHFGFYFMRSQGYFIVASTELGRFFRFDLKGGMKEVPGGLRADELACGSFAVVPSPDGRTLGWVRASVVDCPSRAFTSTTVVEVRLLDAATLEPRVSTGTVSLPVNPATSWTADGELVLTGSVLQNCPSPPCPEPSCFRAWHVGESGRLEPSPVPSCNYPATTSSEYSRDGRLITVNEEGVVHQGPPDPAMGFGCPGATPRLLPICDGSPPP